MKAIETLKKLEFVDASDSTHWREAFPEYQDHDLPGGIFLKWKMGSVQLAKRWQSVLERL